MPALAPAVSALARQTMRTAFEELERTITPADERNLRKVTTIQQVRAVALEIETQLAARQALRSMRRLSPLLNGLEHYAKVVEILCNGTPFLSWIWSPITLILRVASEYIEAFEEIMKGYSKERLQI
jgi:ABC-type maltose transport system permease subunit